MSHALHVRTQGQGTPVVLLHSSGLSGRQWRRLEEQLVEAGFRAIIPDLTGHGASPSWQEPRAFSCTIDVQGVVATLREHGPAHVVGHSYGGLLGLLSALEAPELVRSLIAYEPVALGVLDHEMDAATRAELPDVDRDWGPSAAERERWLERFVNYWSGPGAWSQLRPEARAEFVRVAWVLHEGVRELSRSGTPRAAFRGIRCPVTLMNGELSPPAARRIVSLLAGVVRGSRAIALANVGHLAPLTHPALVNQAVLTMLQQTRSGQYDLA
jgi:pimeloyl-ACP methyl ester carboxylesterase